MRFRIHVVLVAWALMSATSPSAFADDLDEVIVFDSTKFGGFSDGLIRQRLGLVDADGEPLVDGGGNLVPLESADGKRKAFDMKGGEGTKFLDALKELKADGGTITIVAHGREGCIQIDGKWYAGIGQDTGIRDDRQFAKCVLPAPELSGLGAKTSVTINNIVCQADKKNVSVHVTKSVAETLQAEIEFEGGTVTANNASTKDVNVTGRKEFRAATGVTLTQAEEDALDDAIKATKLKGVALEQHRDLLQAAFDEAIGSGKAVAVMKYKAPIDGTIIESADPAEESQTTCRNCAFFIPALDTKATLAFGLLLVVVGVTVLARRRRHPALTSRSPA